MAVEHLHKCSARHVEFVELHVMVGGDTVWKGEVDVFEITGNPKAKRCYAWSHAEGREDRGERFVAVLEIPPITSALDAVNAQIVKDFKSGYSK
jgi:hypothetical protein